MNSADLTALCNKNPDLASGNPLADRYLSPLMQRVAQRKLMLQADIWELNELVTSPTFKELSELERQLVHVQLQVSHTLLGTMLHRLKLATGT